MIFLKSRMLRVTSVLPVSKAVAAIALSEVLSFPRRLKCPAILAILESTGTTIVVANNLSICSISCSAKPGKLKSSNSVIAEM